MVKIGCHLSGSEVARQLNISRSAISQSLKRSTSKIYKWFLKKNSPYETFQLMSMMCNCHHEEDKKDLFKMLPIKVQREIQNDAAN